MPQPPAYKPSTSFFDDERDNVGGRSSVKTSDVDAELEAVSQSINAIRANLSMVQRDDGHLRDASVKLFALSPDVLNLMVTQGDSTPRGAWLTDTHYNLKDVVTQGGATYLCSADHVSDVFDTDLAAHRWAAIAGVPPEAAGVPFTPSGELTALNVQEALEQTDSENRALSAAAQAATVALATDLANGASAIKGAALVAFDEAHTYPDGSMGAGLAGAKIASGITFKQAGTGTKNRTVEQKLQEIIHLNDFTGADPTRATDSGTAIANAIAACPVGGTLKLNGRYKFGDRILVNKTMTIEGIDARAGNLTDYANSGALLQFSNDTNGIVVSGGVTLTLRNVVVAGKGATSTFYGIDVSDSVDNALSLERVVVQDFDTGINLHNTFYTKLRGASIQFCKNCLRVDGCYNVDVETTGMRARDVSGSTGITTLNDSHVNIFGGSIESWREYGVSAGTGSIVNLFGTYFEGVAGGLGWNIFAQDRTHVTALGCLVYLNSGPTRWYSVEGAGTTVGAHIRSHNNMLRLPTDTTAVTVYTLNHTDIKAYSDISGDVWVNGGVVPGANVKYLNTGFAPTYGTGQHRIMHPATHPYGNQAIDTVSKPLRTSRASDGTSGAVTPHLGYGDRQVITMPVAAVALTIGNPSATPNLSGEYDVTYTIRNTSAGSIPSISWGSLYKVAAVTPPASGYSKSITFRWDGTYLIEIARTPNDVPN